MEYSPPPLFKQGASARAKVVIFSVLAIVLLLVDSRLHSLTRIREVVATALYPLQVVALFPRDAAYSVGRYFITLSSVQEENQRLRQEQIANAQTLQQVLQLTAENDHLRKLLSATERLPVKSVMSEILYDARDAFSRKVVLDRGTRNDVAAGQPVIDDLGVVGQVTRVFPFSAEVTLLTDKEQAIPVQVVRNGLRGIAYGKGHSGSMDLRYMPVTADIRNGDILVTSGIDGVYPAGLAVAKVVEVETKSSDAFARIVCEPLAGIGRNRQLLILLTDTDLPPNPVAEEARKEKAASKAATAASKNAEKQADKKAEKDASQEAAKEAVKEAVPATSVPQAAGQPSAQGAQVKPAPSAPAQSAATAQTRTAPAVRPAAPVKAPPALPPDFQVRAQPVAQQRPQLAPRTQTPATPAVAPGSRPAPQKAPTP